MDATSSVRPPNQCEAGVFVAPSNHAQPEYLTRRDIATILQVSPKQAGRLMEKMPTILIGRLQRRVLRADFEEWQDRSRRVPVEWRRYSEMRDALTECARGSTTTDGSVHLAAARVREGTLKRGRRSVF